MNLVSIYKIFTIEIYITQNWQEFQVKNITSFRDLLLSHIQHNQNINI